MQDSLSEALLPPSTDDPLPDHQPVLTITNAEDEADGEHGEGERIGTISSARFNILSTMVGGGCLSLPLAFQQSGNSLLGPVLLIVVGMITEFCFRLLVASAVYLKSPHPTRPGKDSFESITEAAFGPKAYLMSQGLVFFMCFFGAVGYAVLLRDMMQPINDRLIQTIFADPSHMEWLSKNLTMFLVILVVTPSTTLQTLTALKNCGATSMISLFILGSCIVFRSIQCQINHNDPNPWYSYMTLWPESPHDLLNAIPLYISCFVCHYNILPVHNELQNPTPSRVSWWLRSTTWYAVFLYLVMGWTGSAYGHCTPTGKVQGNVLLDFDENDPLLLVGRMCLALTITLAFPMLVIPGRDIVLRSWMPQSPIVDDIVIPEFEDLQESLLSTNLQGGDEDEHDDYEDEETPGQIVEGTDEETSPPPQSSYSVRLLVATVIFWTAGTVASCVESIDVVWDLLGSSLSILLSYLIPCGTYLAITKDDPGHRLSKAMCWILIIIFVPLMVISTGNAIQNTFFS